MSDVVLHVGHIVNLLRRARGFDQETLAKAAQISTSTLMNIERGQSVRPTTLAAVAVPLGASVEEIRSLAETLLPPPDVARLLAAFRQLAPMRKQALLLLVEALNDPVREPPITSVLATQTMKGPKAKTVQPTKRKTPMKTTTMTMKMPKTKTAHAAAV